MAFICAAQPAESTIRGRVRNEQTGAYLEGALVEVAGTARAVVTGRDGSFSLTGRFGSPVTLNVSYTGLDSETLTVTPAPGAPAVVDVALGTSVYKLEAFNVSELREGNAHAITQQKNALNVKEVVATDAFGTLRDGNVGELLVLLPGVVGEWVGNDIRTVQVRGFNSNLTSVTVDGSKLANAESAGTDRNFEWDAISADHIESVEVIKAPTPDMDADSIGGAVNLKTKSAFNYSDRRRITASVGATYESVRDSIFPNGSVSYSEVFGAKRNLGLSFNWGYSMHNVPRDGTQLMYPTTTDVPNYINQMRIFEQENIRERTGGGLKFDYKLSEESTLYVNLLASWFNEQKHGRSSARRIRLLTNAASIVPGYTDDRVEWRATNNTRVMQELIQTPKEEDTAQIAIGGQHRFEHWTIDYDANLSGADTHYNSRKLNRGSTSPEIRGVGIILDRTNTERSFPQVIQTSGPDIYDIANYRAGPLTHRDQRAEDEIRGAQFNAERHFTADLNWSLKAGVKVREQERTSYRRDRRWNYVGPDGRPNTGDEGLERFAEERNYRMAEGRYPAPTWLNIYAFGGALGQNPSWFEEDIPFGVENRLTNDRLVEETVQAGYVQARFRVKDLSILAGIRYERTDVEGESALQQVTPAEAARRRAWVGPVTTEEAVRRLGAEYGSRIRSSSDYANVFPGLHLRYEPRRGLVFRGSYSTSVGRPNFGSIIPDTDVNYDNQVVAVNNTDLKPQFARSIDLGVQYYFEPVGVVSVNLFHKRIEDFIFNTRSVVGAGPGNGFNGEFEGFELRTQGNGGSATVKGVELNYMQQLTFLPGVLKGLTLIGNYTQLKTSGSYGGSLDSPTDKLVRFVPYSANAGLAFTRRGLEIRVKSTYKGEWLSALSSNVGAIRYTESRINWDLNVLYRINQRYSVFFDWMNIFNDHDDDYQYRDTLVRTHNPSGSRMSFGVRFRL